MGKFNIGITAGIESTACHHNWLEGCNRMNLILVPSKHSRDVLTKTVFSQVDNNSKQVIGELRLNTPIEILFEGVDLDIYLPRKAEEQDSKLISTLNEIPEDFNFLFVGHWLSGDIGEDRKNVGFLIKTFYTIFSNTKNPPGLILKTSHADFSVLDKEAILEKIRSIKSTFNHTTLPNVYVLHGDLTNQQMSDLYANDKVKVHINLTKGEGFGRPLLEASLSNKPIITSNWSGHLDFLPDNLAILLGGELKNIHKSAANDFLLPEAQWFNVDLSQCARKMQDVYLQYSKYIENAKKLSTRNRALFSLDRMNEEFVKILSKYTVTPEEIKIKLPKLMIKKEKVIADE